MATATTSTCCLHHYSNRFHASSTRFTPMTIPRRLLSRHFRRRFATLASLKQEEILWTQAPLSAVDSAAESLFRVSVDVRDSPSLASSFVSPGQYVQVRVPDARPTFLAIASPPVVAAENGEMEFLIKDVEGSTAAMICRLRRGDVVELSHAMGKGFDVSEISPPEKFLSVYIFATGSGISPIRSLLETGFGANCRSDVRLYYGARNLQRMAYQDKFKEWESSGVKVIPVLSQPDAGWQGERGYVQAAFSRAKQIQDPLSTGAILCGHKQMTEDITSILVEDGVSRKKILKNF